MKKIPVLIIPVLLYLSFAGLMSCAKDEVLLVSDTTYTTIMPVAKADPLNQAMSDYMANRYLKFSKDENRMFFVSDSMNLMSLSAVYTPEGEDYEPGKYNFGWPVATMLNSTIIVSTQRKLMIGQPDDNSGKGQLLIISNNSGQSWSKPFEVQNLQPYGYKVSSQSAIGNFGSKISPKRL